MEHLQKANKYEKQILTQKCLIWSRAVWFAAKQSTRRFEKKKGKNEKMLCCLVTSSVMEAKDSKQSNYLKRILKFSSFPHFVLTDPKMHSEFIVFSSLLIFHNDGGKTGFCSVTQLLTIKHCLVLFNPYILFI